MLFDTLVFVAISVLALILAVCFVVDCFEARWLKEKEGNK